MTMVGGFDVHRKQITFDYVDNDGLVRWGEIRPATRTTLRGWLGEHCPEGDGELAVEGCTGWRYVGEELARRCGACIWGIRPRPRGCGVRRSGPRPTAPMRGCCARLLLEGVSRCGSRRRMWWRCARWAGCIAR